jgi:hypothetical protein
MNRLAKLTGWATLMVAVALGTSACGGDGGGGRRLFDWTGRNGDHPDTGERWAILLYVSTVTNHYQDAREAKKDTAKQAGWDELIVLHEAARSKLLRGPYSSPGQASKHLEEVRGFTFKGGGRPFTGAVVVKLPDSDYKPMFPQWKLSKAEGEYTVCVAVFYNYTSGKESFSRRRWAAEMYCKHLREEKNREAYFHHGESRSTVTIGSFPRESVRTMKAGKRTITKIVDPRIDRVQQQHPHLIVNGWTEIITVPKDADNNLVERKTAPTYVVKIPEEEGEIHGGNRAGDRQPRQTPRDPAGTGRPERISPWP